MELLRVLYIEACSFRVEGVCRVRVKKKLRQEDVEDVDQVKHRGP